MRGYQTTIERVTGHRPPTCPWRAFSLPIVREVLAVEWSSDKGNLTATIGTDGPAQLVAAIGLFERSVASTLADERKIRDIEREATRRAKDAARKAGIRG